MVAKPFWPQRGHKGHKGHKAYRVFSRRHSCTMPVGQGATACGPMIGSFAKVLMGCVVPSRAGRQHVRIFSSFADDLPG